MNDRDSNCKFSKVLVLIQADVLILIKDNKKNKFSPRLMYFYQLRPLEKKLTWQRLFIAQVITRSLSFISINQSLSELNSSNLFPSSSDYHCGKRDLDGSYYPNDIALILLDWEATTSNYVRPICLYHPQQGDLSHHTQLFSAGLCSDYFSTLTQYDSPPGPHIRLNILHIFIPHRLGWPQSEY